MKDYIALATKGYHEWWRYIVGAFIIFIIWQAGSIPFLGAVMYKLSIDGKGFSSLNSYEALVSTLDSNLTFFLLMLSFLIGFIGVLLITKFFHNQKLIKYFQGQFISICCFTLLIFKFSCHAQKLLFSTKVIEGSIQ